MSSYRIAAGLFTKALAIVYLIAFASFGVQIRGLIGSQGILPAADYLRAVAAQLGGQSYLRLPTLFWFNSSDATLIAVCCGGVLIAIAAALTPAHGAVQRSLFALLFAGYLSLVGAGQVFMGYQWDFLLLEAGFLALFFTPDPIRIWLFHWLLFRLMFESGAVKLLSHDGAWKGLTALTYHWETQPLPLPPAWYLNQSPAWFERGAAIFLFAVELVLPFLIFGPRPLRYVAACGTILLQVLILLTGNYTFFNILTIALCLLLFDDGLLSRWFAMPKGAAARSNRFVSAAVFVLLITLGCAGLAEMFGHEPPTFVRTVESRAAPFGIVNSYGLFASMTTTRREISVEGSNDGAVWLPYVFRFKPERLDRAPMWAAPHQPRLDWQMWFAALGSADENPWFAQFLLRLLQNSPPVLSLLESDPFHGRAPLYVRALVYKYHFTDAAARRKTGRWWRRENEGTYFPAVSLKAPAIR